LTNACYESRKARLKSDQLACLPQLLSFDLTLSTCNYNHQFFTIKPKPVGSFDGPLLRGGCVPRSGGVLCMIVIAICLPIKRTLTLKVGEFTRAIDRFPCALPTDNGIAFFDSQYALECLI
jgi:hypothetical protein